MSTDSIHNNLQLVYPWIDSSLFEELLLKDFPRAEIVVQSYYLNAATAKGENYSSQMIRAKVNYSVNKASEQIHFIIKTAIPDEGLDEKTTRARRAVFYTEISVYDEVLTKVHDVLKSIGHKHKLHGRCYATNRENAYLIFEDLSEKGFKNVDRRVGLDITHCKSTLSLLAKYHAATAVVVEKYPSLKSIFDQHSTVTGQEFFRKMMKNFAIAQREFCKRQPGLEKLVDKFTKIEDTIYDRTRSSCIRDDNDLNVILHGDLWSNNIMYKYNDNGELDETILVDFQICYYGPPVLDVTYILYTSCHNDVSELDWDMLVQYYYDELRTTLQKLDYSKTIPSLMEFNAQVIVRGMFGAFIGVICESGRLLENVGEDGLNNFISDDAADYRLNMLLNPKAAPKITRLLKYFDRRGYYECG